MSQRKLAATHSRKLKFRPVLRQDAPPGPGLDPRHRALAPTAAAKKSPRLHGNERGDAFFFIRSGSARMGQVAVIHEGRWQSVDIPCALDAHAARSPDGSELAVAHEEEDRLVVDVLTIASGDIRRVIDFDSKAALRFKRRPAAVAFTPDGIVVLAGEALVLQGDDPAEPAEILELDRAYGLKTGLQGRLLITKGKGSSVLLLTRRDGAFQLLRKGKFDLPRYVYEDVEGRVFLDVIDSVQEIVGIADAVGWSPEDLPELACPEPSGEPAFAIRSARAIQGRPTPAASDRHAIESLADGTEVAVTLEPEGGYQLVVDGEPVHSTRLAERFNGPLIGVSPDRRAFAFIDGLRQVATWDIEGRAIELVGTAEERPLLVAHAGDFVLFKARKIHEIELATKKTRPAKGLGGRVESLVPLGDVVIVCTEGGGSGPPKSKLVRRTEGKWTSVAELPLGVRAGWTHEGRHFVTCWHGLRAYELLL